MTCTIFNYLVNIRIIWVIVICVISLEAQLLVENMI